MEPESQSQPDPVAAEPVEPAFCSTCGTLYESRFCGRCGRARSLDRASSDVTGSTPVAAPFASTSPAPNTVATVIQPFVAPEGSTRRVLIIELVCVAALFWVPVTVSAVIGFVESRTGGVVSRFPHIVSGHPLENMILGALAYATSAGVVPVTLYLLWRSGSSRQSLGLARWSWRRDALSGLGLAAASFVLATALADVFFGIANHLKEAGPSVANLPHYYVIEGIVVSATTAIVEEVVMNGYLVTRLEQLGVRRIWILVVAVLGRTAYHSYYGVAMIFTVPFTIMVTFSFMKNRRLGRAIAAHFLYDAVLLTVAILIS